MDGPHFDAWTKCLTADRGSRRAALRLLGGGAIAAILARLGVEDAEAACAKPGRKCGQGKKCCPGAKCQGGTCKCAGGRTRCGTTCVDTEADAGHCGACGISCGEGQTCAQGNCVCPENLTHCGAACVDTATDTRHCGGCDRPCAARETCQRSICRFTGGCQPGVDYCSETDPQQSRCPDATNDCRCITDVEGTTSCAYIHDYLQCSVCGTNADCPAGWACHDAKECGCPYEPSRGFLGRACAPVRGVSEVCGPR